MKNSAYCLRLLLSVSFLTLLLASCSITDDPMRGGTATLVLDVPMLQTSTRATVEGDDEENAIYNLRVVILSQGAKSINKTFSQADLQAGTPLRIENVPVGPAQMYVIANEGSLGKDYTNLSDLQKDVAPVGENKKVLIKDEPRTYFPKRRSELNKEIADNEGTKGLPMSWMDKSLTIEPPSDTPQTISVNLVRTVAKLNILMSNALTESITIDRMSFGEFFGNCLYLFAEQNLDVPGDTEYVSKEYTGLSIEIAGGGTAQLVLYTYPSFAWTNPVEASPYTIGFHTQAGKDYLPQSFVNSYGALNSIARNTQVNIHAVLSAPANVQINFEVVPWIEKSVEVPPFN